VTQWAAGVSSIRANRARQEAESVMRRMVCCLGLIGLWSAAFAEEPAAPAKKSDQAQIARWIEDLDHDDFAVREAATLALGKADVAALPALQAAIQKGSPEVRIRATQVLVAWYRRGDKEQIDAVEDTLEGLLDSHGTVGDLSDVVWSSQWRAREVRCLEQLERLGARVKYREDRFGADRDDLLAERKFLSHIAITPKWTGGDEGLKFVRRIQPRESLPFTVYRVNGNNVSDAAFQALEDAGVKVEKRGAKLGVGNNPGFDPMTEVPGFRIGSMEPGSAAEKAGLQIDDILIAFNEKPIQNFNDLVGYLLETKPGDKTEFTILREKQGVRMSERLSVELGDW
jgi:hypothetical protein